MAAPGFDKTLTALPSAQPAASERDLATAGVLANTKLDHYLLGTRIGAGGMGEVYVAHDLSLDREVAVKVLPLGSQDDRSRRDRLVREAQAQARLNHPNICHIYYIGEANAQLFFAMERIKGETFAARGAGGKLRPHTALDMIADAARGLRAASLAGFVHRDVKPSNLMIDDNGVVKVLDFGLVASNRAPEDASRSLHQTCLAGTPLYMAPEQAAGDEIDFRADIYGLGCTLHFLLTGNAPFAGDTAAQLSTQHATAPRPVITKQIVPGPLAGAISKLLAKMMAPEPNARHRNYDELIADLENISARHNKSAGAIVRYGAGAFDGMMLAIGVALLEKLLSVGGITHAAASTALAFAVLGLYGIGLVSILGSTPGQALFELELVSRDSTPPSRGRLTLRLAWLLGPFMMALSSSTIGAILAPTSPVVRNVANAAMAASLAIPMFAIMYAARFSHNKLTYWDLRSATQLRYRRRSDS